MKIANNKDLILNLNKQYPGTAHTIRVCLSGQQNSLPPWILFDLIGRKESLKRIKECIEYLKEGYEKYEDNVE